MNWTWNSAPHPISDIRDWSNNQRLEIRPDFQRKEVWSPAARILLMDTILRKIPIPKIFFQAIVRNKDTYRVVIDGQQRIKAILSFVDDDFHLAKPYSGEYSGRKFSELPQNIQDEFLSYKIDTNEIVNAPDDVVRDIYSRVNKYTVALNKQELRRADLPGEFLSLSEKLAICPLFEAAKIFTITNSKRMGDVEFVSELLAQLLSGPQEKRETLDDFYLKYQEWDKAAKQSIEARFQAVLDDLLLIFDGTNESVSMLRFKQKADFYSLFAAIDDLRATGGTLEGKLLEDLRADLRLLDEYIEPESKANLLSRYAIQCVSQGNSIASRTSRRNFLKHFLQGTYLSKPPSIEGVATFHSILEDLAHEDMCPTTPINCPLCDLAEGDPDYSETNVFLTWPKNKLTFQMENATFIHWAHRAQAADDYFVWDEPYKLPKTGGHRGLLEDESEP
ncbi:MAG: DUF262 domain-containing protein [Elusimicrobiota bacterium]|nr:MAG: DUF262 domain-containing protein [Elusimicrobiota bacterium]